MKIEYDSESGLLTGHWGTTNTSDEAQHFEIILPLEGGGVIDQAAGIVVVKISGAAAQLNTFETVYQIPLFAVRCGGQMPVVAFGYPSMIAGGGNPGAGTITAKGTSNPTVSPAAELPVEGEMAVVITGMLTAHTTVAVTWMIDLAS